MEGMTPEELLAWANGLGICEFRPCKAAIDEGMKPEDARYLLPEATKTSLVMTINARSLQNLFTLRLDSHAQWEIRELAVTIERELECRCDGQWCELIGILREARND